MTQTFTRLIRPLLLLLSLALTACTTYSGNVTSTAASQTRQITTASGEQFTATVDILVRETYSHQHGETRGPEDRYIARTTLTDSQGNSEVRFVPPGTLRPGGSFQSPEHPGYPTVDRAFEVAWYEILTGLGGDPIVSDPLIDANLDAVDTATN